jgi:hypothetical protein
VRGDRVRGALALAVAVSMLAAAGACASRGPAFAPPVGGGAPAPDAAPLFEALTAPCAAIDSYTAEAALSGRLSRGRIRGRLHLGLTRAGQIRLEAVAPFGPPLFIVAGTDRSATLLLPRDGQVLRDTPPADIIEALAGLSLSPRDLLEIATGCVGAGRAVQEVVRWPNGLHRASLEGDRVVWWQGGEPPARLRAASLGGLLVSYEPGRDAVRLTRGEPGTAAAVDLRLAFAQAERNVTLGPEAFTVDVPAAAAPVSLQTLRESGLLGR